MRRTLPVPMRGLSPASGSRRWTLDSGPWTSRQHQGVSGIFALEHRAHLESLGQHRGHVLAAVNGQVDVAGQQRVLDFLHEQALSADLRQRRVLQAIARGLDDDDLAGCAGRRLKALGHQPRLEEGELTSSTAETKRGHCAGFFAARVEPAVVSVSSGGSSAASPNSRVRASL